MSGTCLKWFTSVVITITRQMARCESESDSRPRPCASVHELRSHSGWHSLAQAALARAPRDLTSALLKAERPGHPGAAHLVHWRWRWHLAFRGPGLDLRLSTGRPEPELVATGSGRQARGIVAQEQGAAHARAAPSPFSVPGTCGFNLFKFACQCQRYLS
jgi:hypothetical protein